ncbi:GtrA family protein [Rossellomorea oryzaecorticis]|uniref:GtrA family protein n=1 Tax=Rossellomorea oryzaecorticis TaxID=1396505 RepID=A0ABU9K3X3_9BACI
MFIFTAQFWKFVIVGFINTFNYYILYLLFFHLLDWHYMAAHIISFVISMVGSFYLNSYFTYRTKPTFRKFIQFPMTYVVNILISTLAMWVFVDLLALSENVAPLLSSALAIPFTFVISKIILTQEG